MKDSFKCIIQSDSMMCGITCLQMVCKHFGREVSLRTLSKLCVATSEGVSMLGVNEAANKLGLRTMCARTDFDTLSKATLPCVLHWNQNHFVVLYKVRKGRIFYVADPGKGLVKYNLEEFGKHWVSTASQGEEKGIAMFLEPTLEFYSHKVDNEEEDGSPRSFQFLFGYIKQYRKYFGQIVLGLLVGSLLQLILPFLTQSIVDVGIKNQNIGFIWLILLGQLMLTISRTAIDFIRRWLLLHISLRINISLVSDFFIKLLKLPMSFFDTKLMGCLVNAPSVIRARFKDLYDNESSLAATDYFYKLSCDSNYIRRQRIKKDRKWTTDTEFGTLDITINLSKPEKDPKAIAAAKNAKQSAYPKCQLCKENEGYAGRVNHPARQNHRIIPLTINNSDWFFQYSPYVYYNEHCIVFNSKHTPMKIERATFGKLLDFVTQFPHYFVGSNADLPIVGGSILSHDHFQGGHYTFAMAKAPIEKELQFEGFSDVKAGIVKWPMSVIRISGPDKERLIELADKILLTWRGYTDEDAFIYAETDGEPHNTITPIARRRGDDFELDLVLRNNITTGEHPLGVYHPHAKLHHIKKENIGLIEVMGLAVLPARLKDEMAELADALVNGTDLRATETLASHAEWAEGFLPKYDKITKDNVMDILHEEIGLVFNEVLQDAGVYKCTPEGRKAFERFIAAV
mgnify:CR=1 FL=1